jgi:hypothetical protein
MSARSAPGGRHVAPSRLTEFFQEIQDAFTQAGDEDRVPLAQESGSPLVW